ncbi:MAG: translation initiation factor IF-2 [Chloroflexi bacterium]|nr:translation initiation factor IF-2 [Chloroflexota bacterium]MQG05584.1 translation initiation factor IF-2 [SAR202 cluster bacterium]
MSKELTSIEVPQSLTVKELAVLLDVDPIELVKQFMRRGLMYSLNQYIDFEIAAKMAEEFSVKTYLKSGDPLTKKIDDSDENSKNLQELETRPPVIAIFGHVDHGKTTLLDYIRKSRITEVEAGGITQKIGAYQCEYKESVITVLDTPGHYAFSEMRSRGAKHTDIAVLVVAADDGVMPQTIEAISHIKGENLPIVVAINKIDRPQADIDKVKRQLVDQDVVIEEWGGDVMAVPISALNGDGIDTLMESILVLAEVLELRANPNKKANGVVIEGTVDKRRGVIASLIIHDGTLKVGDQLVLDNTYGKIRAMTSDRAKNIDKVLPGGVVEVLGLNSVPEVGVVFEVMESNENSKNFKKISQESKHNMVASFVDTDKVIKLVVKAGLRGSVDSLKDSISAKSTDEVPIEIIYVSSGSVNESDVLLAETSNAIILGFNTYVESGAQLLITKKKINVQSYDVIYELLEYIDKVIESQQNDEPEDVIEGVAEVRALFQIKNRTTIAGLYVRDGFITRKSYVRVIRQDKEIFRGKINSLKHFQNDVGQLNAGLEGGLVLDGFNEYVEGDFIEAHSQVLK